MTELYRNIKNRRLELKLTQTELAEKVGYADKGMISRVENGKVDLSQSQILKFADALETTPSQLMGWESKEFNNLSKALHELAIEDNNLYAMARSIKMPSKLLESIMNEHYSTIPYDLLVKIADYYDVGISALLKYNTCKLPSALIDLIKKHDFGLLDADAKIADFLSIIGYELLPVGHEKDFTLTNKNTNETLELSLREYATYKRMLKKGVDIAYEYIRDMQCPI